jgi:hypothetical protein
MWVPDDETQRDLQANHGPITNPVDRFAHLPEPTRRWLELMREEDTKDIAEVVRMMHAARTVGRFGKWMIITIVGMIIAGASLGEAVAKYWGWIFRGGSQ